LQKFPHTKLQAKKNAEGEEVESNNSLLETKIMQVLSSAVRNHEAAEKILCMNTNSVKVIESGLGLKSEYETTFQPDSALKRKSLFFLQALVTSDSADFDRLQIFAPAIQFVTCHFLDPVEEESQEIREMVLSMLIRILDNKQSVNSILELKTFIVGCGVKRIHSLRKLDGEEKYYAEEELNLWESLVAKIACAIKD